MWLTGMNVGNMTTLRQTVLKIAILLRFGIEKLQKCVYLVSPCHHVRIEQREAN
jgi:transcription initiation factor IIE alpha subunit